MCRRKRQQKHLFANTMYKGFVRRGAVVIPDTIEEGPDLEEVKRELLARMRAIQAKTRKRARVKSCGIRYKATKMVSGMAV